MNGLSEQDVARLRALSEDLNRLTVTDILARSLPDSPSGTLDRYEDVCRLDHGALLIFPHSFEQAIRFFATLGFEVGPVIDSVVVKARLCERYGLDADRTDVRLTHLSQPGRDGGRLRLEVFMLLRSQSPDLLVERERRHEHERHLALRVHGSAAELVPEMRWLLREHGGFIWDSGGYNPNEEPSLGGMSVLYFARVEQAVHHPRLFRLEIQVPGRHPTLTDGHRSPDSEIRRVYGLIPEGKGRPA